MDDQSSFVLQECSFKYITENLLLCKAMAKRIVNGKLFFTLKQIFVPGRVVSIENEMVLDSPQIIYGSLLHILKN